MQIWVDADACPSEIKLLLYRTATRRQIKVTFVANQRVRTPESEFLDSLAVPSGIDVADRQILELVEPGDLVITADVPLAAEVVAKDALALSFRGHLFTAENVGERLALRNMLDQLREGGSTESQVTGGPSAFGAKDKQAFANQLDRWCTKARN